MLILMGSYFYATFSHLCFLASFITLIYFSISVRDLRSIMRRFLMFFTRHKMFKVKCLLLYLDMNGMLTKLLLYTYVTLHLSDITNLIHPNHIGRYMTREVLVPFNLCKIISFVFHMKHVCLHPVLLKHNLL